jgi:hypothetical protein
MKRSYDGSTITITNWSDFNGRKDVKEPTWFRVDNGLPQSEGIHGLDPDEKWLWVFLLCIASKKNTDSFTLNVSYIAHQSGVIEPRVISALEKLKKNGTIAIAEQICTDANISDRTRTDLALTDRQTDTTDKTDITDKQVIGLTTVFDFEVLYQKYPRKIGKSEGIKRCKAQIKTETDYQDLSLAIDRYSSYLRQQGTEAKHIKHFSSFMSVWRDWLDPETGSSIAFQPKPNNPAYRRMEGNQLALQQALSTLDGQDEHDEAG